MSQRRQPRGPWCEIIERSAGLDLRFGCVNEIAFLLRLEDLKQRIPAPARRWSAERKTWRVSAAYKDALREWQAEWFDGPRRRTPTPPPPPRSAWPPIDGRVEAYRALHLLPTAPPELVKVAYRTLATLHHPDKGGDTATMQAINAAYELLGKGAA